MHTNGVVLSVFAAANAVVAYGPLPQTQLHALGAMAAAIVAAPAMINAAPVAGSLNARSGETPKPRKRAGIPDRVTDAAGDAAEAGGDAAEAGEDAAEDAADDAKEEAFKQFLKSFLPGKRDTLTVRKEPEVGVNEAPESELGPPKFIHPGKAILNGISEFRNGNNKMVKRWKNNGGKTPGNGNSQEDGSAGSSNETQPGDTFAEEGPPQLPDPATESGAPTGAEEEEEEEEVPDVGDTADDVVAIGEDAADRVFGDDKKKRV